jgi:hypothetical protein
VAIQGIECTQDLADLAPQRCFIATEAIELARRKKKRARSTAGLTAGSTEFGPELGTASVALGMLCAAGSGAKPTASRSGKPCRSPAVAGKQRGATDQSLGCAPPCCRAASASREGWLRFVVSDLRIGCALEPPTTVFSAIKSNHLFADGKFPVRVDDDYVDRCEMALVAREDC